MATTDVAMKPAFGARSGSARFTLPLGGLFLALLALAIFLPLWQIISLSLIEKTDLYRDDASFWPPSFDAYVRAWTGAAFPRYFANSLIVAVISTIGCTVAAILAAYAFARGRFPGRNLLFLLVVGTLMSPSHITLIPNYLTFARFGLLDSFACLIIPFLASGFSIFFLRQYIMGIPVALDEAARIDGAGTWKILWTIIVPLSWPAIAVVALFQFMAQWNEFIWPLLSTTSEDMRTVQIGLRYLLRDQESGGNVDWPLIMAATMIVLAPILAAYVLSERHLIRGITLGSFK